MECLLTQIVEDYGHAYGILFDKKTIFNKRY